MKNQISILKLVLLLFMVVSFGAKADPPTPPAGKVWVLNHQMSDEFDAQSPSLDKWSVFDKSNSWGRTAAFDKRIHEVSLDTATGNYFLTMNPMWYYEDERFPRGNGLDYYFAGGGMSTQAMQTYGYFEVRIRPSDFPMGSGVFMNSRGTTDGSCNEKYATELDIIENMGYTGPFTGNSTGSWNNVQHVNSHAKPYSDASGSCQSLPYESENSGVNGKPLAEPLGFNTVGMWWKDANTASYYNNDEYFGTITPKRDFYLPMPVIIVMETYSWGSDENNATNPKPEEYMFEDDFRAKEQRAVVYDWVRTWKLVDVDESIFNDTTDNIKGKEDTIIMNPAMLLPSTLIFSAKAERTIMATVYNPEGAMLAEASYTVNKGVKSIYTEFAFDSELAIAEGYKIIYTILDGETKLQSDTSIVNVKTKPLEKQLWRDGIPTSLEPGKTSYTIPVKYETDEDCVVNIEIRKPDNSWFGSGKANVSAGNGVVTINAKPSSPLTKASNYYFKVYMHRKGMDWRDPLLVSISPTIYFNVEDPMVPAIKIVSAPKELEPDVKSIDVEFNYATYENGMLDITLVNSEGKVVAREHRVERIGSRTLTRTIDVDSSLTAADDYKIAISFVPDNSAFPMLTDTVFNVKVKADGVSIDKVRAKAQRLSIYPNPTNDKLFVDLKTVSRSLEWIRITDMNGRILFDQTLNDDAVSAIDVSDFKAGMYLIQAFDGELLMTGKFVKE